MRGKKRSQLAIQVATAEEVAVIGAGRLYVVHCWSGGGGGASASASAQEAFALVQARAKWAPHKGRGWHVSSLRAIAHMITGSATAVSSRNRQSIDCGTQYLR